MLRSRCRLRRVCSKSPFLRLAYLAPDITAAILEGRQPEWLTATVLIEHPDLPLSWPEQRAALGFR
jgi:site-specific DNA recombinase